MRSLLALAVAFATVSGCSGANKAATGATGTPQGFGSSAPGASPTTPAPAGNVAANPGITNSNPAQNPAAVTPPMMQPSVAGGAAGSGAAPMNAMPSAMTMGPSVGGSTQVTPDPPGTVTLTMGSFMLAAGQEIYKCQNFDNPFGAKDTAVNRIVTDMAPGSHHLHVYHMTTSSTRTLEDCTIADFHPLMHAASRPHVETTYPAGMAVKLLGTSGIRIQVHYLNTTTQALMVNAVLKLSPTDASTITKWISELYFSRATLSVPPGNGQTVTTSCTVPNTYGPIGLVYGGSHMHMRGVDFTAKTGTGLSLGETTQWDDPPPFVYDPPVMLNPGDTISWTCTYDNQTGKTLTFGESAQANEMCIYLARFYSAPDGAQLECQAQGPTGMPFTRTN